MLANADFTVRNRNINGSFDVKRFLAQKLSFDCKQKNLVSHFKERVEQEVRKLVPEELACNLLELRIGERLSLPNNANLTSLFKKSKCQKYEWNNRQFLTLYFDCSVIGSAPINAVLLLNDRFGIQKSEFVMQDTQGEQHIMIDQSHDQQPQQAQPHLQTYSSSESTIVKALTDKSKPRIISNQATQITQVTPSVSV